MLLSFPPVPAPRSLLLLVAAALLIMVLTFPESPVARVAASVSSSPDLPPSDDVDPPGSPSPSSSSSLSLVASAAVAAASSLWSAAVGCFHCPSPAADGQYDPECLHYAVPPFPICLFHSVDYFVAKSKDGALRCCGKDRSNCRCPKKDTPQFAEKIDEWCLGIQACASGDDHDEEGEGDERSDPDEAFGAIAAATTGGDDEPAHLVPHVYRFLARGEEEGTEDPIDGRCPTSSDYPDRCLANVMPPYPLCSERTVDGWVAKALKGREDCCSSSGAGGATTTTRGACSCPQKTSQRFVNRIADWCASVETCLDGGNFAGVGAVVADARIATEVLNDAI